MNPVQIDLPSLAQLNDLTDARKALLLLRVLSTSDMAWTYMLLKSDTLADLSDLCGRMLDESEGPAPYMSAAPITLAEAAEARMYLEQIDNYAKGKAARGK